MERREFLKGVASTSLGLGVSRGSHISWSKRPRTNFMDPVPGGRRFEAIREARGVGLKPGDEVLVRQMDTIAPDSAWSRSPTRGKWQLRPYRLSNEQSGKLLLVNDPAGDSGPSAVPPEFEVKLDLPGWYAIWIGVPMLDLRPTVWSNYGGVDLALDSDPAYSPVAPDRGARHGKVMGAMNVEVDCYWKCAKLDGRTLRVRAPYGTFLSFTWGLVRTSMSSLRLVKLSDEQIEAFEQDGSSPSTKRVIFCMDGFTDYFLAGDPGKGIDARYPQQYRGSDVKMYFLQTPATGVASWPSRVTSLLGEGVTDNQWKSLRKGDQRAYEYIQWAVRNKQEGFRVAAPICRGGGEEFHASLRMNLFFANSGIIGAASEDYFNGRFWKEHPELRKQPMHQVEGHMSATVQLDYAQPKVRQFILDILIELATNYDVDGINMDFTRWPPVADPAHHDFNVLTTFIQEVRTALDRVSQKKGRKLALSAMVTDGYHANMNLVEQKIDLQGWLASKTLDFICVQAWDHRQYLSWAKRYKTPYYLIHDQDSFKTPRGYRDDPDWHQPDRPDEDPVPGEESRAQPHVNSALDPTECDEGFLELYKLGIDGVCPVNNGGNFVRRLGHVEEMAERVKLREVWGQRNGPGIQVF